MSERVETRQPDLLDVRRLQPCGLLYRLGQGGRRFVVGGLGAHGGYLARGVAQGSLGACSRPPCQRGDRSSGAQGFPEYRGPGFDVLSRARVDKDPACPQGGRLAWPAHFTCHRDMVGPEQVTVARCIGVIENRADDLYPAAEQCRRHDRDVGFLVTVDAP